MEAQFGTPGLSQAADVHETTAESWREWEGLSCPLTAFWPGLKSGGQTSDPQIPGKSRLGGAGVSEGTGTLAWACPALTVGFPRDPHVKAEALCDGRSPHTWCFLSLADEALMLIQVEAAPLWSEETYSSLPVPGGSGSGHDRALQDPHKGILGS